MISYLLIMRTPEPVAEVPPSVPPPSELVNSDSRSVPLAIVLGKTKGENSNWASDMLPEWTPFIYSVDNELGYDLHVPNRGNEAMPYLTFIIDHYHSLPDIIAFMHASRKHRHNQDISEFNDEILRGVNLEFVRKRGYVNLRCKTSPGCEPSSVLPHNPTDVDIANNDPRAHFADIYATIFALENVKDVPHVIGGICCAQFLLTRERILQRPLVDYVRMKSWVLTGSQPLKAGEVGWVFEKIWHVVFGEEAVL
ncbi:hypothetical protein EMCG_04927 [[Emmonsia] crescens]|uniref:Uncharacterized protein n=1 Tax=[Emmonsia] crescens TaxID=73230 RepID=A0A0G2HQP6_9EURO|nr:hypothetical protein EMCG_04927 [Emmonsia crescens UAMH 3008]